MKVEGELKRSATIIDINRSGWINTAVSTGYSCNGMLCNCGCGKDGNKK